MFVCGCVSLQGLSEEIKDSGCKGQCALQLKILLRRMTAVACTTFVNKFQLAVKARAKRRLRAIRIAHFTISTTKRTFVCVIMRRAPSRKSRVTPIRLFVICMRTTFVLKNRLAVRSKSGQTNWLCRKRRAVAAILSSILSFSLWSV